MPPDQAGPASGDVVIGVSDLVKRYRGAPVNALDGVSFTVAEGALFCLLGPNGAGKTTMASILTTTLRRPVRTLSGGTRRKLEIVRALLPRPRVLFLDEPTTGLDPQTRRGLWGYLGQARAELGVTVFLTTHYLEEAEAADAVCVLAAGRVIEYGSPGDIKARYPRPAPTGPAARDMASLEAAYLVLLDRAGGPR